MENQITRVIEKIWKNGTFDYFILSIDINYTEVEDLIFNKFSIIITITTRSVIGEWRLT